MAATVAHSQPLHPCAGLHPLQAKALLAASSGQQDKQHQQRDINEKPFDPSKKLSLKDFVKVRTLGTGTVSLPKTTWHRC
jgi:hypothetical protein